MLMLLEDSQGSRGNVMSSEHLHILLAVGLLFVMGLKAGEAALLRLHQQRARPVALGNPSVITRRSEFTGKGTSDQRSHGSTWDLHLCRYQPNTMQRL